MKIGFLSLSAVALLQLTASQPFGGHRHLHRARQNVVTDLDVVTVEASEVIVYVDENGNPFSTTTLVQGQAEPTTAPSSAPAVSYAPAAYNTPSSNPPPSSSAPVATSSPQPSPAPYTAPSSSPVASSAPPSSGSPSSTSSSASPSQTSSSGSPGSGFGSAITYSPYNADNSCKSSSQVAQDFSAISGYGVVRLYGCDCNQIANVLAVTKSKGIKLFVGIFDITQIPSEVATIKSAVNGDWSSIQAINVGNELVNNGASAGSVVAAIGQARSALQAAGYTGPVVTVDTMVAMSNNIELCTASDFCAINCHAFFDGGVTADGAGSFVLGWAQKISAAANGKMTVITETGWPSQGDTNKMAVPGQSQQQAAVSSLKSSFSNNMILFTAYNDLWKKNSQGQFNAEQYWGILGNAPS